VKEWDAGIEVKFGECKAPVPPRKDDDGVEQGSLVSLLPCGLENSLGEVVGNLGLVTGHF
jgi:hypothetical protein